MKIFSLISAAVLLAAAPFALAQDAVEAEAEVAAPEAAVEASAEPQSLRMKLKLRRDMTLEGAPVELANVKMNTIFGDATLPLNTIAGIRFAGENSPESTVILRNGDSLTGSLVLENVKFVSQWGEATINVSALESVTFVDGMAWASQTNSMGNARWALSPAKASSTPSNYSGSGSNRVIQSGYIQNN